MNLSVLNDVCKITSIRQGSCVFDCNIHLFTSFLTLCLSYSRLDIKIKICTKEHFGGSSKLEDERVVVVFMFLCQETVILFDTTKSKVYFTWLLSFVKTLQTNAFLRTAIKVRHLHGYAGKKLNFPSQQIKHVPKEMHTQLLTLLKLYDILQHSIRILLIKLYHIN